jgi:flavin-dependent dehydrogenase
VRREPLIIGAGPAGTAAAIRLGQAGHRPVLIERSPGPADKVCGDFLGVDAIERLNALGVDPTRLGAVPIRHLRLTHRDQAARVELPFPALGLSRRVLDEALLRRAEASGATTRLGHTVRRISREQNRWLVHTGDDDPVAAAAVFLATGKHDLRNLVRPGVTQGALGLKTYLLLTPRQTAALAGEILLLLFPGGYAGLQCVEAGRAVLCVALRRTRFQALGGTWANLLHWLTGASPLLGGYLAGAQPLLPRPLAVAGIPYGFLHRGLPGTDASGLFRLGDQVAVIPSLTGDGIAIALHSGILAADAWLGGADCLTYHRRLRRDLGGQMQLARIMHAAAMAGALQAVATRGAGWFPGLFQKAARSTRLQRSGPIAGSTATVAIN